jgi:hypothetical protein
MQRSNSFIQLEINGQKYLLCKLPGKPFSTLHDPETKQIVGQWNNHDANYEIFPPGSTSPPPIMTEQQFEQHMRRLIASGAAFTFH